MDVDRYESLRMPRAWIVSEQPTKEVVHVCDTETEAVAVRDSLNRWLDAKPDPARLPLSLDLRHDFTVDPTDLDARMDVIIDAIFLPEAQLDLLEKSIQMELRAATVEANSLQSEKQFANREPKGR
jgi:hypothetical protein